MGRRTHDPTAEDDDQCFGHHRDLIASTMSRCQIYEWQLPSFGTLTTSTFAEIRRRGKLARVIGNLTSPGPTKILILYWAMQDRKQLEAAVDRRSSAHQKLPARKHKEKIRSQMLTTPPRNQPPPPPRGHGHLLQLWAVGGRFTQESCSGTNWKESSGRTPEVVLHWRNCGAHAKRERHPLCGALAFGGQRGKQLQQVGRRRACQAKRSLCASCCTCLQFFKRRSAALLWRREKLQKPHA